MIMDRRSHQLCMIVHRIFSESFSRLPHHFIKSRNLLFIMFSQENHNKYIFRNFRMHVCAIKVIVIEGLIMAEPKNTFGHQKKIEKIL